MTFNWTVIDLGWAIEINFAGGSFVFVTFLRYWYFSPFQSFVGCVIQKPRILAYFCALKWNFDEKHAPPSTVLESPNVKMSFSLLGSDVETGGQERKSNTKYLKWSPFPLSLKSGPLISITKSVTAECSHLQSRWSWERKVMVLMDRSPKLLTAGGTPDQGLWSPEIPMTQVWRPLLWSGVSLWSAGSMECKCALSAWTSCFGWLWWRRHAQ